MSPAPGERNLDRFEVDEPLEPEILVFANTRGELAHRPRRIDAQRVERAAFCEAERPRVDGRAEHRGKLADDDVIGSGSDRDACGADREDCPRAAIRSRRKHLDTPHDDRRTVDEA